MTITLTLVGLTLVATHLVAYFLGKTKAFNEAREIIERGY